MVLGWWFKRIKGTRGIKLGPVVQLVRNMLHVSCKGGDDVGHPDDSTLAKADCDNLESAIPDDNNSDSEGDDTFYQDFNDQF
ncbi:hypothetical protein Tco_1004542 [Tanacetum coccineum]|uniref:Uncharacterized protein n=1 Tax=Tanacetum coccineum TaxID=301880 RepID=A0ABQ5FDB4_9ASTR